MALYAIDDSIIPFSSSKEFFRKQQRLRETIQGGKAAKLDQKQLKKCTLLIFTTLIKMKLKLSKSEKHDFKG